MFRLAPLLLLVVASSVLADEYPKVVRRNGQVCVQSLDPAGAVVEQCRAEGSESYSAPAQLTLPDAPPPPPATTDVRRPPSAPRRAARLVDDDRGAARGIAELAVGQLAGLVPVLVTSSVCPTSVSCTLVGGLTSFVLSSLVAGLMHFAFDGKAGLGWAFLGNLIGGGVALLVSVVAVASGSGLFLLLAGVIQVILPPPSPPSASRCATARCGVARQALRRRSLRSVAG